VTTGARRRLAFISKENAGAAGLAGAGSMIAALPRLQSSTTAVDTQNRELAMLKIAGGRSLMRLLATHPPLEARITALEGGAGR
jgi:Zn-dependent protease with chaperone function